MYDLGQKCRVPRDYLWVPDSNLVDETKPLVREKVALRIAAELQDREDRHATSQSFRLEGRYFQLYCRKTSPCVFRSVAEFGALCDYRPL